MSINIFQPIYKQMNDIALGDAPLPEFPLIVDIEITSYCNLKCIMCDHTYMDRKQEMMREDVFNRIIEQCKLYKPAIRFIMYSEPFLHSKSLQFAERVKESGLLLHITTNGTVLTKDYIDALIKLPLDSITFSLQGATDEEYAYIRKNNKLPVVKENIEYLLEKRGVKPFIQISTTVSERDSKEDIIKFKERWNRYADLVTVGTTSWARIARKKPDIFDIIGIQPNIDRKYIRCSDVTGKMCFFANGDITVCCSDVEGKLVMGNILKDSMKTVWDSEPYNGLRLKLKNMKMHMLDLCKDCYPAYDFAKEPNKEDQSKYIIS